MHDLLLLAGAGRRKAWMWKGGVPKAAGGAPVPAVSTAPTAPPKSDRRETRRSENHVVKRRKREAAFPVVGSPQEAVGAGQGKRRGSYRIPVSKAMRNEQISVLVCVRSLWLKCSFKCWLKCCFHAGLPSTLREPQSRQVSAFRLAGADR